MGSPPLAAHHPRRGGSPRLERARRGAGLRRRLRRPPRLRHRRHRPDHRARGSPHRHHRPAELARRPPGLPQVRRAPALLRRDLGLHGLDGEPLHRGEEAPQPGRLHARRRARLPARLRVHGLLADPQAALSRRARPAGGHRGEPAARHALRLLVGYPEAGHPGRERGGHAGLRDGRAAPAGDPAPAQAGGPVLLAAHHRADGRAAAAGRARAEEPALGRLHPPQPRGVLAGPRPLRAELQGHRDRVEPGEGAAPAPAHR